MGAQGRAHVMSCFTTRSMQHATLEVYDALLGSHLADQFRDATSENLLPGVNTADADAPLVT